MLKPARARVAVLPPEEPPAPKPAAARPRRKRRLRAGKAGRRRG